MTFTASFRFQSTPSGLTSKSTLTSGLTSKPTSTSSESTFISSSSNSSSESSPTKAEANVQFENSSCQRSAQPIIQRLVVQNRGQWAINWNIFANICDISSNSFAIGVFIIITFSKIISESMEMKFLWRKWLSHFSLDKTISTFRSSATSFERLL